MESLRSLPYSHFVRLSCPCICSLYYITLRGVLNQGAYNIESLRFLPFSHFVRVSCPCICSLYYNTLRGVLNHNLSDFFLFPARSSFNTAMQLGPSKD